MFNIAAPFGPGTGPDRSGAAANTLNTGGATGQCTMDTFQVSGSGRGSPVICGSNEGQHSEYIYVKLSSAERSQPHSKYPVNRVLLCSTSRFQNPIQVSGKLESMICISVTRQNSPEGRNSYPKKGT